MSQVSPVSRLRFGHPCFGLPIQNEKKTSLLSLLIWLIDYSLNIFLANFFLHVHKFELSFCFIFQVLTQSSNSDFFTI